MMRTLLPAALVAAAAGLSPYPGSRLLCSEHVSGNSMHITWQSYASKDDVAKVVAFYEKELGTKAGKGHKGEASFDAPTGEKMSIYSASREAEFPSCREKPVPGEKTVILVSRSTKDGK